MPKQKRVLYCSDARHYYLFAMEPPMSDADAWRCVDDVAATSVDTFVYMVERGDGLFYPSKVGGQFGSDIQPFEQAAYWRAWHNMKSLEARGLDPLTVLVDRAHEKGLDFVASVRLSSYLGLKKQQVADGSFALSPDSEVTGPSQLEGNLAQKSVRDHVTAVFRELITDYHVDGIEMDWAAAPGGMPAPLRADQLEEFGPVLTDWVAELSALAKDAGVILGARIFPTEAQCQEQGFAVREWIQRGLLDYVSPMMYGYFVQDPNLPLGWVVDACIDTECSVYGWIQPFLQDFSGHGGAQDQYPLEMRLIYCPLICVGFSVLICPCLSAKFTDCVVKQVSHS